jgi:hypothetical protein
MSSLYALIDSSNIVQNLFTWDGVTQYDTPGYTKVPASGQPNAQIGGTYTNGVFTAPVAPPLSVPATVTAAQLKMALQAAGILAAVSAAVAASPDPLVAIYWGNASSFDRADARVAALGAAAGQTPAQMDAIFVAAAQYPAV